MSASALVPSLAEAVALAQPPEGFAGKAAIDRALRLRPTFERDGQPDRKAKLAEHGRRPSHALIRCIEELERKTNRETRRAAFAAVRCQRGRGFLVNRKTGASYPAPCRCWRDCDPCARAYGLALSRRWSKVTGLRAFVVLTMPADRGDWRSDENRRAMMRAWRRLYERLCRRFGRRPKAMHFKEHAGDAGRLHLNVLWDWGWLDQGELSGLAAACGFGPVCHISRVGRAVDLSTGRAGSSAAVRYSAKQGFRVVAYARKTGGRTAGDGDDWPKRVRRWSASRAASREMGPRPHNPDWSWQPVEPSLAPPAGSALPLAAEQKLQPRLLSYDAWLARQRRAWAPRGPDGQILNRGPDGKFRIATE